MALSQTQVLKLYNTVIEDVIASVRDAFLDEGVDEQVLQEMKQVWTNKLMASKAVEIAPDPPENQQPPQILANNSKTSTKKSKNAAANANAAAVIANNAQDQKHNFNQNQNPNQQQVNGNSAVTNNNKSKPAPVQAISTHSTTTTTSTTSSSTPVPTGVAALDPNKMVPIQITLPVQPNIPNSEPRVLTIQVPASALQENQLHQVITGPIITSIMPLPPNIASTVLQQHVNAALQNAAMQAKDPLAIANQLDGAADTSDEDASDVSDDAIDDDDDDDDLDQENDDLVLDGGAEEEPLNSEDDVTDEDAADLFDTDNVIVCQYDKITRSRNKWKFYLKDGIMNINGKDYVFQKSNGDAEW